MKQKWVNAYMQVAETFSKLSYAKRLKVGAVVVKEHRIISIGYNGTPEGWDNNCENTVWSAFDPKESGWNYCENKKEWYKNVTKEEVIHAEANAITKLARAGEGGDGASLFSTHAPCIHCAKLIQGTGIKTVYYGKQYRDNNGIKFLEKSNINVIQINIPEIINVKEPMKLYRK